MRKYKLLCGFLYNHNGRLDLIDIRERQERINRVEWLLLHDITEGKRLMLTQYLNYLQHLNIFRTNGRTN